MFLFKNNESDICCCFISIKLKPRALQLMPEQNLSDINILYSVRPQDNTSALHLGAISINEISNKKYKYGKNIALNRLCKGRLFTVWELKQGSSGALFSLSWKYAHQVAHLFLSLYACPKMTTKVLQVLILGLQIKYVSRKTLQSLLMVKVDWPYSLFLSHRVDHVYCFSEWTWRCCHYGWAWVFSPAKV